MSRRRFLFSGFSQKDDVAELVRQLNVIGGVYVDSDSFVKDCTHVICKQLIRTQKVLSALASGAWILTDDYVVACYKARRWLSERKYEWSLKIGRLLEDKGIPLLPGYYYGAPKRCRQTVAATGRGIFATWHVAVFVCDRQKKAVYEALLKCGGATVYKVPLNEIRRPFRSKLTHVFADEVFKGKLERFNDCRIPCVSPDYIRNVLLRDLNCDVGDFSIASYTSDNDPILTDLKDICDKSCLMRRTHGTRSGALTRVSNRVDLPVKRGHTRTAVATAPFGSPSSKRMKKTPITANCKRTRGPMDRFLTTSARSRSSGTSSLQTVVISDSDDEIFVENVPPKRWTSARERGSKDLPLVIDSSPDTCAIKALAAKLNAIRMASASSVCGSEPMPLVVNSCLDRCESKRIAMRLRPARSKLLLNGSGSRDSPLVISDDSGCESQKNRATATQRSRERFLSGTGSKDSPVVISDSDSSGSDRHSSKHVVTRQCFDQQLPSTSTSLVHTDGNVEMTEEVRSKADVVGERLTVADVSASVVDGYLRLLKDDESLLDWLSFSNTFCVGSSATPIGSQAKEVTSTETPSQFTSVLEACIDTKFYELQTIDYLQSVLSNAFFPEPHILAHFLWTFLLNCDVHISTKAYRVLETVLVTHPPNSAKMQLFYQRVICNCKSNHLPNFSSGWDRIIELLEFLYEDADVSELSKGRNTISPEVFRRNCETTLMFLVRLFEMDLQSYMKGKDGAALPLVARLVWPNGCPDHVNSAVRRLIDCCLELSFANVPHHVTIVDLTTRLLASVAQCAVLADVRVAARSPSLRPVVGCALTSLAHFIVRASSERCWKSSSLHSFLESLRPTSLQLMVSRLYLDSWAGTNVSDKDRLTMTDILSEYFPLLKSSKTKPTRAVGSSPRRLRPKSNLPSSPYAKSAKCKVDVVNRRNFKGESQLHKACIRNDVDKVRSLLAVPGIDVLAADNAGWTPLHEACNYGSIECVRELLAYRPRKPIQRYFKPDFQKEFKLNVLVTNADGVTPLHDAVVNGHVEVARLLLQHGGKELLKAKMSSGKTPLDLAESQGMFRVLTSFIDESSDDEIPRQEEPSQSSTDGAAVSGDKKLVLVALYHLVRSYVAFHRFHELLDLVRSPSDGERSSSTCVDVSRDTVLCLVNDVNAMCTLKHSMAALSTTSECVGPDGFDADHLVRGLAVICSDRNCRSHLNSEP